jgi:hypothetical protein
MLTYLSTKGVGGWPDIEGIGSPTLQLASERRIVF